MKAIRTFIIGIMMLIGTSAFAQPMNYNAIRNNARFLTDRMAYTLGIASMDIIDDLYRINYDYIYGVNEYLDDIALGYRYDDYLEMCAERDYALRMLLGEVMWSRLIGFDYFYRPIIFENHRWRFGIYAHDYNRGYYHYSVPRYYDGYRGGHFIGGMHRDRGIGSRGPGMVHIERRGNNPGGMNPGGNRPGGMNPGGMNPGGNRPGGNMNQGGNRPGGNMNQGGNYQGGQPGNMNQGGQPGGNMNQGGNRPGGNMNQGGNYQGGQPGNMNRGNANRENNGSVGRSESNVRSSSRSNNYGSPNRSGSSSSYGSSSRPSSSSSSATRSSSSSSRGNMGGGSRGGNGGGPSRSGNAGGGSHGRR